MSDSIKHECAVSMLRLRKHAKYYHEKYGTPFYGYQKLCLLLEKQHNRGQDGAGIAGVSLNPTPGFPAYQLEKSAAQLPLADLLERIGAELELIKSQPTESWNRFPFAGELFLGHLRYGTFGKSGVASCHPFVRENACLNRTLLLAGNFNLTTTDTIFTKLLATGHHPASHADGALILHLIGHYLEEAYDHADQGFNMAQVLSRAAADFDGAYTLCGLLGDGQSFALRDPAGIRPGFFYVNDEIVAVASERPALQTAFDLTSAEIEELPPGEGMIVNRAGDVRFERCLPERPLRRCVFERIYFSRGNDEEIHRERKALGRALLPSILPEVEGGIANGFFSYIPNTAQISFHGLLEALLQMRTEILPRFGQIAIKDAKFRTFIADAAARKDFFKHVYDVTYGLVRPGEDTLVVLDDSIVRGNTMRNAILPILDRLKPRKIVVASAAPPICYPDCYGIDMASLKELVAFEAVVRLLKKHDKLDLLEQCYAHAQQELLRPIAEMTNCVRPLYDAFSFQELVDEIGLCLCPQGLHCEVKVIFQTIDDLHRCCPNHRGDWYFTGDYPTPGGNRVVNRALVNYMEKIDARAY